MEKIIKPDEEWRQLLSKEAFYVTRKKGTERPFSGEYYEFKDEGVYTCVCCGLPLFDSEAKYHSGSGWPSFYQPYHKENIEAHRDNSLMMIRTEVLCGRCNAHLGHVFEDGPQPTGLRYCINSLSLKFVSGEEFESESHNPGE